MDNKNLSVRKIAIRCLGPAAAALALSGCFLNPDAMPPNETRQVDQLYHSLMRLQPKMVEPQIETITMLHEVQFGFGEDELSGSESEKLLQFISESMNDPNSRVAVDGPRKSGGTFDILTRARLASISNRLSEIGVKAEPARSTINSLARPDDSIVVTVTRTMLIEPDCDVPKTIYGPRPTHIWSCSSAVTLGRMVADPRDLERGRTLAPGEGEVMAKGIERYRTDKTKALKSESTAGSN